MNKNNLKLIKEQNITNYVKNFYTFKIVIGSLGNFAILLTDEQFKDEDDFWIDSFLDYFQNFSGIKFDSEEQGLYDLNIEFIFKNKILKEKEFNIFEDIIDFTFYVKNFKKVDI